MPYGVHNFRSWDAPTIAIPTLSFSAEPANFTKVGLDQGCIFPVLSGQPKLVAPFIIPTLSHLCHRRRPSRDASLRRRRRPQFPAFRETPNGHVQ